MIRTLSALSIRVKNVLQSEGLVPLLRRGFAFLVDYFFKYETLYLYEYTMKERNEADFMPKVQNFTFQVVSTNQQANELAANGFDLRSFSIYARRRLDKGAIAFCILIGRELVHIGWVAMTEEAKNTFEPFPYRVDFLNKEACTGGTITIPKYEGKGVASLLKKAADKWFKDRKIEYIILDCFETNKHAMKIYEKWGFETRTRFMYKKLK